MTKDEYVEQERKWLNEHNDLYREALQNLSNSEYVRGLLRGVEEKLEHALAYNPRDDAPHVATFILGALQAKMEMLLTDLEFIDDYESRRDDLNATVNAESQEDGSQSGQPDELG